MHFVTDAGPGSVLLPGDLELCREQPRGANPADLGWEQAEGTSAKSLRQQRAWWRGGTEGQKEERSLRLGFSEGGGGSGDLEGGVAAAES